MCSSLEPERIRQKVQAVLESSAQPLDLYGTLSDYFSGPLGDGLNTLLESPAAEAFRRDIAELVPPLQGLCLDLRARVIFHGLLSQVSLEEQEALLAVFLEQLALAVESALDIAALDPDRLWYLLPLPPEALGGRRVALPIRPVSRTLPQDGPSRRRASRSSR